MRACQQDLDHAASHRLKQFEAFIVENGKELRKPENICATAKRFRRSQNFDNSIEETIKKFTEHETVADATIAALAASE
jgi:hypothetical protein